MDTTFYQRLWRLYVLQALWVELTVERVLDSKKFVKEWLFIDEPDQLLRFVCRMIPSLSNLET